MPTFLCPHDLAKYIPPPKTGEIGKLSLLDSTHPHSIKHIATVKKLSRAHLYKDFRGLYAIGNLALLSRPIVALIGTREPNQYTRHYTAALSEALSHRGFVIISGGAIGTDSIAHTHSGKSSILVLPCGIDVNYPSQNARLLDYLRQNALVVSEYHSGFIPHRHSFLERNRIIIALSDVVIIPQADLKSGSLSSALISSAIRKPLFVLPHRMNESLGTQQMLSENKAECIYSVEGFVERLCHEFLESSRPCESHTLDSDVLESKCLQSRSQELNFIQSTFTPRDSHKDEIIEFVKTTPLFEDALKRFGDKIFEYELDGKIMRSGMYVRVV